MSTIKCLGIDDLLSSVALVLFAELPNSPASFSMLSPDEERRLVDDTAVDEALIDLETASLAAAAAATAAAVEATAAAAEECVKMSLVESPAAVAAVATAALSPPGMSNRRRWCELRYSIGVCPALAASVVTSLDRSGMFDLRKGRTNGRSGKLVTSCSTW